jgi:hypothetical protein
MGWAIMIALPVTIGLAMFVVPEPVNAGAAPHGGWRAYLGLFGKMTVAQAAVRRPAAGRGAGHHRVAAVLLLRPDQGLRPHPGLAVYAVLFRRPASSARRSGPGWRRGSARTRRWTASLVFAVLYIGATLVPGGNFALTAAAMFIAGLPYAAGLFLLRAMMADAGDEVRLDTGVDRTGLMFSILSATTKIGHVFALIPYLILQWVGFRAIPGVEGNSEGSLTDAADPVHPRPRRLAGGRGAGARGYPLTPARHDEIRKALEERDGAATAA